MATAGEAMKEEVVVEVSQDKMLGVISFMAPENGGGRLTLEEIKGAIQSKGIIYGVNEQALEEVYQNHSFGFKYIIAKGDMPVDGINGEVKLAFDVEALNMLKPKENPDGTVDLRDLGAVRNVKKGDPLATRTRATEGSPGKNVFGQVIKARKGKDVRMPKGRNTKVLEDGITLVADIDGKLEYDDHNVYVNAVYTVMGDLDSSIGNVDFVGSVVIYGSVHSGYTIKAGGTVEVRGPVDDAVIIAGEDIILSYGIQGTNKSTLKAKGNVITKFIQNTQVEAGGNVISEALLHSNVTAGDSILVEIGKGTIVGGSAAATNIISARSIGSPMGTVTSLKLGVPPMVYAEHKQLGEEMRVKQESLNKIEQGIKFILTKMGSGKLPPNHKDMLQKFYASRGPALEEYDEIKARYNTLSHQLQDIKEGLVKCTDSIYPGVKVAIGSLVKYIDEREVHVVIRKQDGDIHVGI